MLWLVSEITVLNECGMFNPAFSLFHQHAFRERMMGNSDFDTAIKIAASYLITHTLTCTMHGLKSIHYFIPNLFRFSIKLTWSDFHDVTQDIISSLLRHLS